MNKSKGERRMNRFGIVNYKSLVGIPVFQVREVRLEIIYN